MKTLNIVTASFLGLMSISTFAATVDGSITSSEYQWNTDGVEGSAKWETHGGAQELNDASGGDTYDINFLGTNVAGGKFQFGAVGGEVLSGRQVSSSPDIFLSDFAISISNPTSANPTTSSAGFDFAIHLVGVNDTTGVAEFQLLSGGDWIGADIYGSAHAPDHITETYRMENATSSMTFFGEWSANGTDENVLEGEFDLSALGLLSGADVIISTYLTMACVNDEALVHADLAAVPVPAALWLFAPALAGFMGLRRRVKTTV
ncbi:MAG: VPLPA-CTERM sorting domain-containing protein [Methylophagaceae bacterium]